MPRHTARGPSVCNPLRVARPAPPTALASRLSAARRACSARQVPIAHAARRRTSPGQQLERASSQPRCPVLSCPSSSAARRGGRTPGAVEPGAGRNGRAGQVPCAVVPRQPVRSPAAAVFRSLTEEAKDPPGGLAQPPANGTTADRSSTQILNNSRDDRSP
jgi:hypothetical protein